MKFFNRYWFIIKDALILITISTLFVTCFNQVFKKLKKSNEADSLITAIAQSNEKRINEVLSEDEFKEQAKGYANFHDYVIGRVNKQDEQGRTPLMWAAYVNYTDLKKLKNLIQNVLLLLKC
jgi:hypothetical protein